MSLFASKCAKGKQVLAQQVLHLGFKSFSRFGSHRTGQQAEIPAGVLAFGLFARTSIEGVWKHHLAFPSEQEARGVGEYSGGRRRFDRGILFFFAAGQPPGLRPVPAQERQCRPLKTLPPGTGRAQDPVRGHFELVLQQNPKQTAGPIRHSF